MPKVRGGRRAWMLNMTVGLMRPVPAERHYNVRGGGVAPDLRIG